MKTCPECKGEGFVWLCIGSDEGEKDTCPTCDGKGTVEE